MRSVAIAKQLDSFLFGINDTHNRKRIGHCFSAVKAEQRLGVALLVLICLIHSSAIIGYSHIMYTSPVVKEQAALYKSWNCLVS